MRCPGCSEKLGLAGRRHQAIGGFLGDTSEGWRMGQPIWKPFWKPNRICVCGFTMFFLIHKEQRTTGSDTVISCHASTFINEVRTCMRGSASGPQQPSQRDSNGAQCKEEQINWEEWSQELKTPIKITQRNSPILSQYQYLSPRWILLIHSGHMPSREVQPSDHLEGQNGLGKGITASCNTAQQKPWKPSQRRQLQWKHFTDSQCCAARCPSS